MVYNKKKFKKLKLKSSKLGKKLKRGARMGSKNITFALTGK